MIVRRWISKSRDAPVTTAAPDKPVSPELILYEGARAPEAVEVRRTYEPLLTRLIKAMSLQPSRHVTDLVREQEDGRVARYEAWPAAHFEPLERPTLHFFRQKGKRLGRSPVLYVTPAVSIRWRNPSASGKLAAPLGPLQAGLAVELGGNRELKVTVQAPVDPEVELFVLSPAERAGELSLEGYLDSYLTAVEVSLRESSATGEGSRAAFELRSRFEEAYDQFVYGRGRIHTEIERPELLLGEEDSRSIRIALNPESPGATMMVVGARVRSGEQETVAYSDLLPLFWQPEGFEAGGAAEREAVG